MRKQSNLQIRTSLIFLAGCLLIAGCAAPKPVLYPNVHLRNMGQAQAEQDIAECQTIAKQYASPSNTGGNIVKSTAVGAGVGAAGGAVGGAIRGSAGSGSAVGAAAGATVGLLRGLFQGNEPNHAYKVFVNRCLSDRGYESVGWE